MERDKFMEEDIARRFTRAKLEKQLVRSLIPMQDINTIVKALEETIYINNKGKQYQLVCDLVHAYLENAANYASPASLNGVSLRLSELMKTESTYATGTSGTQGSLDLTLSLVATDHPNTSKRQRVGIGSSSTPTTEVILKMVLDEIGLLSEEVTNKYEIFVWKQVGGGGFVVACWSRLSASRVTYIPNIQFVVPVNYPICSPQHKISRIGRDVEEHLVLRFSTEMDGLQMPNMLAKMISLWATICNATLEDLLQRSGRSLAVPQVNVLAIELAGLSAAIHSKFYFKLLNIDGAGGTVICRYKFLPATGGLLRKVPTVRFDVPWDYPKTPPMSFQIREEGSEVEVHAMIERYKAATAAFAQTKPQIQLVDMIQLWLSSVSGSGTTGGRSILEASPDEVADRTRYDLLDEVDSLPRTILEQFNVSVLSTGRLVSCCFRGSAFIQELQFQIALDYPTVHPVPQLIGEGNELTKSVWDMFTDAVMWRPEQRLREMVICWTKTVNAIVRREERKEKQ